VKSNKSTLAVPSGKQAKRKLNFISQSSDCEFRRCEKWTMKKAAVSKTTLECFECGQKLEPQTTLNESEFLSLKEEFKQVLESGQFRGKAIDKSRLLHQHMYSIIIDKF